MRDLILQLNAVRDHYCQGEDDDELLEDQDDHDGLNDNIASQFAWIDWRSGEEEIVEAVCDLLQNGEELTANWNDDRLVVNYNGAPVEVPLTMTRHDRYVTISSLAHLLRAEYDFWLLKYHLEDDTHAILITTKTETQQLEAHRELVSELLEQLRFGYDYFNKIEVPYLDHHDNNPNFKAQSEEIDRRNAEIEREGREFIEAMRREWNQPKTPWWKFWSN